MTKAVKHDSGKPAYHLIDVGFNKEVISKPCNVAGRSAYWCLNEWSASNGELSLLRGAFSETAKLYGTQDPEHVSRIELARVLAAGQLKYPTAPGEVDNWRKGLNWSQLWRAAYGHIQSHRSGDVYDAETGLMHLSHALGCIMMLYCSQRDGLGTDDRKQVWPQHTETKS